MGIISRILGISQTAKPADPDCWKVSGNLLVVDLSRTPELGEAGTALRFEGNDLPVRVLVARDPEGGYHALKNRCTHAGRRLDMHPSGCLECCSVNKSKFSFTGEKMSGPAKGPASAFPVYVEGQTLSVDLSQAAS